MTKKQKKRWRRRLILSATVGALLLALGISFGVATNWGKELENLRPEQSAIPAPSEIFS